MSSIMLVLMEALLLALVIMPSACCAWDFYVGGRDGWVEHPGESYNSWACRNRFQVEDHLIFRYEKGNDSVLAVDKAAYYSCNTSNPKANYTDGNSVFQFHRSGPFYFISGADGHCAQDQKLYVVVMAVRNNTTRPPSPGTAPSPAHSPSNEPPVAPPTPSLAPFFAVPPADENAPSASPPIPPQIVPSSASSNNVPGVSKGYIGVMLVVAISVGVAFVG